MRRRTALTAGAIAIAGALPGCNALFGRDVRLADDGGDGGVGSDAPGNPATCAAPREPCSGSALPVAGDWDGDGRDSPGLFDRGRWCITNARAAGDVCDDYVWGASTDEPVVGDWNGDGTDTPGTFDAGRWLLQDARTDGSTADFSWGFRDLEPLSGDWTKRGHDTPGGVDDTGPNMSWELSNRNGPGTIDFDFEWGSGRFRMVGDWDGNGTDTPATFEDGAWEFSNANSAGGVAASFRWGDETHRPIVGDWDGDGVDTVGLYRSGMWLLTDVHIDELHGTTGPVTFNMFRWGTE